MRPPERQHLRPVALLLGSNITPEANLAAALFELGRRFPLLRASRLWESPAVGSDGPDFLNMAVLILAGPGAFDLKHGVLRPIEAGLGRVRTSDKFAPRTIDIDVVADAGRALDPGLWKYAHAAVPVAEILPDLVSPQSGERLRALAERLRQNAPIRLYRGEPGFGDLLLRPGDATLAEGRRLHA